MTSHHRKKERGRKGSLELYLACFEEKGIEKLISSCPSDITPLAYLQSKETVDDMGNNVLHYLAFDDSVAEIRDLLAVGLQPSPRNRNGETPLHWAVKMGHFQTTAALIQAGAEINAQDNSGSTPLVCVMDSGTPELVQVLLQAGSNAMLADNDGHIALDIASNNAGRGSEFFATKLLLERLTTVPALMPSAGATSRSGGRIVQVGDIVYVNRAPAIPPPLSSAPFPNQPPKEILSTYGPAPVVKKLRPVSEDVDKATLAAWRQRKKMQEDLKLANAKPPFYSRAVSPKDLDVTDASRRLKTSTSEPSMHRPIVGSRNGDGSDGRSPSPPRRSVSPHRFHSPKKTLTTATPSTDISPLDRLCCPILVGAGQKVPGVWLKVSEPISTSPSSNSTPIPTSKTVSIIEDLLKAMSTRKSKAADESSHPPAKSSPAFFTTYSPGKDIRNLYSHVQEGAEEASSDAALAIDHYIPFLPSDQFARCLDVHISVEQCCNCDHHRWLAWHDEAQYSRKADHALRTVLAAVAACAFPVRVFAHKVKADHTRLASLEVSIALRVNTNNQGHASATTSLKWLRELSADVSELTEEQKSWEHEMKRIKGVHGDEWLGCNLHSKLQTSSWPSTRNLQFKTVLFLATALFGKNFAAEYARLIFFSPTDGTGRGKGKGLGVGIFRRKTKKRDNAEAPAVKGKSKAWQSLQEQRKKAQLAESSADEVIMDEMACADLIDVVKMFEEWTASQQMQARMTEAIQKANMLPLKTTQEKVDDDEDENIDDLVDSSRALREKLNEAITVWENRIQSHSKKAAQKPTAGIQSGTESSTGGSQSKLNGEGPNADQVAAATAFMLAGAKSVSSGSEFSSWGRFFDPILTIYESLSHAHNTLGPGTLGTLRPSSPIKVTQKHGAQTANQGASSTSSIVDSLIPLVPFDMKVAQLRALWLYFVFDHTPCAAMEYVPPFTVSVTNSEGKALNANPSHHVSDATNAPSDTAESKTGTLTAEAVESGPKRITQRMSIRHSIAPLTETAPSPTADPGQRHGGGRLSIFSLSGQSQSPSFLAPSPLELNYRASLANIEPVSKEIVEETEEEDMLELEYVALLAMKEAEAPKVDVLDAIHEGDDDEDDDDEDYEDEDENWGPAKSPRRPGHPASSSGRTNATSPSQSAAATSATQQPTQQAINAQAHRSSTSESKQQQQQQPQTSGSGARPSQIIRAGIRGLMSATTGGGGLSRGQSRLSISSSPSRSSSVVSTNANLGALSKQSSVRAPRRETVTKPASRHPSLSSATKPQSSVRPDSAPASIPAQVPGPAPGPAPVPAPLAVRHGHLSSAANPTHSVGNVHHSAGYAPVPVPPAAVQRVSSETQTDPLELSTDSVSGLMGGPMSPGTSSKRPISFAAVRQFSAGVSALADEDDHYDSAVLAVGLPEVSVTLIEGDENDEDSKEGDGVRHVDFAMKELDSTPVPPITPPTPSIPIDFGRTNARPLSANSQSLQSSPSHGNVGHAEHHNNSSVSVANSKKVRHSVVLVVPPSNVSTKSSNPSVAPPPTTPGSARTKQPFHQRSGSVSSKLM